VRFTYEFGFLQFSSLIVKFLTTFISHTSFYVSVVIFVNYLRLLPFLRCIGDVQVAVTTLLFSETKMLFVLSIHYCIFVLLGDVQFDYITISFFRDAVGWVAGRSSGL